MSDQYVWIASTIGWRTGVRTNHEFEQDLKVKCRPVMWNAVHHTIQVNIKGNEIRYLRSCEHRLDEIP